MGNRKPLVLSAVVNTSIVATAMIDSGATSLFVDSDFLLKNNLKPRKKRYPEILTVVDGRESVGGAITQEINLDLLLGNHFEGALASKISISSVSFPVLKKLTKRNKLQIFAVSCNDIKKHLEKSDKTEIEEDIQLRQLVPSEYHDLLPLFNL